MNKLHTDTAETEQPIGGALPDYHETFAQIYDEIRGGVCSAEVDIDVAIRLLQATSTAKFLDWGCGTGSHARILARRGYSVLGVDTSSAMINRAIAESEPADKLKFYCGDIANYFDEIRPAPFDAVYSYANVLNCLPDRDAMAKTLGVIASVLRSGGRALVDVWNIAPLLLHGVRDTMRELTTDTARYVQVMAASLDEKRQLLDIKYSVFVTETHNELWRRVNSTHRLCILTLSQYSKLFSDTGFVVEHILLQRPRTSSVSATEEDRLVSFLVRRS